MLHPYIVESRGTVANLPRVCHRETGNINLPKEWQSL